MTTVFGVWLGNSVIWAAPRSITTDVGSYEIIRLPAYQDPIELTASRRYGVTGDAEGRGAKSVFRSFVVDEGDRFVSEARVDNVDDWSVVGEELVLAGVGRLKIYRLPDLELSREAVLDKSSPSESDLPPVTMRLNAAVNRQQLIVFVSDVGPLAGRKLPVSLRIGDETMRVTAVDEFKSQLTVVRPEPVAHDSSAPVVLVFGEPVEPIRRVPNGWYWRGYIYDDVGKEIVCILNPRCLASEVPLTHDVIRRNFQNLPGSQSGEPPAYRIVQNVSSVPLETVPGHLTLAAPDGSGTMVLEVRGYDGGYVKSQIHDRIVLEGVAGNRLQTFTHARVSGADCTFVVGADGYHLRFVRFDAAASDIPAPQRFQLVQPIKRWTDLQANFTYKFLERGPSHPVVTRLDRDMDWQNQTALKNVTKQVLLQRLRSRPNRIEDFRQQLQKYSREASAEYEATTGRTPEGIPIPVCLTATTLWRLPAIMPRQLVYWVWKEWPEQDLISLVYEDVLAAAEQQSRQSKQDEAYRELQRFREEREREARKAAEEARQRELAQRQIELDRQMRFRQGLALGMALLGTLSGLALVWRKSRSSGGPS